MEDTRKDGWAVPRVCAHCGTHFIGDAHHRKYCSDECREVGSKRRHAEYMRKYNVENRYRLSKKARMRYHARKNDDERRRLVAKRLMEVGMPC